MNAAGIKTLAELIITPALPTHVLLQFLYCMPHGCTTVDALQELCKRDFNSVFKYLLSLPYSHWHRPELLSRLKEHLLQMKVDDIKPLSVLIPHLSAQT